jgi:hypothetical protein
VYFLRPISCFIVVPSIINYLLCTGFYQRASAIRCSQRVESWLDAAVGGGFRGSRLEVQAALQGLVLPVRTGLFDSQYESVQDDARRWLVDLCIRLIYLHLLHLQVRLNYARNSRTYELLGESRVVLRLNLDVV